MKKVMICLVFVLILVSCASIPLKPVTESDCQDLKGKWEGTRYGLGYSAATNLEIVNDTFPLIGLLTFYGTRVGTTKYILKGNLRDGKIYFLYKNLEHYKVELILYKEASRMELRGDYQWGPYGEGTISLKKVKP